MREAASSGTRLHGLVLRVCTGWAVLGGIVLVAVVAVNVASVLGAALFGTAILGDFELTEVGVALAVFAFLPYCQIAGLNVTADIFTAGASRFWLSLFSLLGAAIALSFGTFLLWRMYYGMVDQRLYEATTTILQLPLWWGYAGCLLSLALLVVASFASLVDAAHGLARR